MTKTFASRPFVKYAAVLRQPVLTERDILNLKRLLNGWSKTMATKAELDQLTEMMWDGVQDKGYRLTLEQDLKGIKWLRDQWKTPRGIERKNNPFGYRESDVLEHFTHFTFEGFYDNSRPWNDNEHHNYIPLWGVHSADGYFEYYMAPGSGYNGGSVEIVG